MRRVRSRLVGIVAALLLQQAAGLAVSIGVACCAGTSEPSIMECCRKGGDGHICPLMARGSDGSIPCRMRSTCGGDHDEALTASVFAFAAPIPCGVVVDSPAPQLVVSSLSPFRTLRADFPPPSPPPRA